MYTPGFTTGDTSNIAVYLQQELQAIAQEMASPKEFTILSKRNTVPTKLVEGMVVLADGTNWNPGAGAGFYGYYGGTWNKLG